MSVASVAGAMVDGQAVTRLFVDPPPWRAAFRAVRSSATAVQLSYVAGSTVKVEQLIGDFDKGLQQPTVNQTETRYGIVGTDLGSSFEHGDRVYFLFGDTIGPGARDPVGYSESRDPGAPLRMDFLSSSPGSFTPIRPPGLSMEVFEVPVAGISLDGVAYVVVKTNHSANAPTDASFLTRFDERSSSFTQLREISRLPAGHFIKMTLRLAPESLSGLPGSGPQVLMFGSGEYRRSNAYLASVPATSFVSGDGTRYFAGVGETGPQWADREVDAAPIVTPPIIGDLSVMYVEALGLWIMTYDSRDPRGVLLRSAPTPWGPWSDPITIFSDARDPGLGTFIHDPRRRPDDGLAGPVTGRQDPAPIPGAAYGPYLIERFTQLEGSSLSLQWVLSTWNPYTVVRMRSTLSIVDDQGPAGSRTDTDRIARA